MVFSRVIEYPLAVILACVVTPGLDASFPMPRLREVLRDLLIPGVVFLLTAMLATNQSRLAESVIGAVAIMIAAGLGLLATTMAGRRPIQFALFVAAVLGASSLSSVVSGRLIHVERDFFGVVRVTHEPEGNVHRLFHGTTLHGQQSLDPGLEHEPSTYFTRTGPIGRVFEWIGPQLERAGSRVAILGLGTGTLATLHEQPQDVWTFYEIDPIIARIAGDPRFFTYLRDCQAETLEIVLGDARMRVREAPDHAFGLIVVDVFGSDSLPVHLLSREAIGLYRSKLAAGGVLAFNLTNRYLDLEPVLGRQAVDAGLACRIAYDVVVTAEEKRSGKQPSIWAVMAVAESDLSILADDPRWRMPRLRVGSAVWTDFSLPHEVIRSPAPSSASQMSDYTGGGIDRVGQRDTIARSPIRVIQLSRRIRKRCTLGFVCTSCALKFRCEFLAWIFGQMIEFILPSGLKCRTRFQSGVRIIRIRGDLVMIRCRAGRRGCHPR